MNAVYLLIGLGLGLGLVIGIFSRIFRSQTDARTAQVEELLPGTNCGACGFAGCADCARALIRGDATPGVCPLAATEQLQKIADLLGLSIGDRLKKVAVVRCGGDNNLAKWGGHYNGVADCRSANLVENGPKLCKYGCLGLGTCARVCPFDAIETTPAGLAVVHPDICTGCGKCLPACPRNLIELVPATAPIHNLCHSPDKASLKRTYCQVSCIACRKCVNTAEEGQMIMDGFLARVNYDNPPSPGIADVCPTGCLRPAPEPLNPLTAAP